MATPNPRHIRIAEFDDMLGAILGESDQHLRFHLHPGDVNWHAILEALTNLMNVQGATGEEGEHSMPMVLPDSTSTSKELKKKYDEWENVTCIPKNNTFHGEFHLQLTKMLNISCPNCLNGKNLSAQCKKREIIKHNNFEEMVNSITELVKEQSSNATIEQVAEHLVRIIRVAKTSVPTSVAKGKCVPIIDFSRNPISDVMFLLSLFTSEDIVLDREETHLKKLLFYVPVTNVQKDLPKAEPKGKCSYCAVSTLGCVGCEQKFCSSCLKRMKAPRIGIHVPQLMCKECTTILNARDAEDWTAKALHLLQIDAERNLKAALACILIIIHTTEVLPVSQLRAVANELVRQGFQEEAFCIISVIREISTAKHDVKIYLPLIKALQGMAGKPGKSGRERMLLTLSIQEATRLANESIANTNIDVPDLCRISKEISVTADRRVSKYRVLVETALREIEIAWMVNDLNKMFNIVSTTGIIDDGILIENNGVSPGLKALNIFLDQHNSSSRANDQCAINFFQGYALICGDKVQEGLDLIEKAVWSGYHFDWLLHAVIPIILSEMEHHPAILNNMTKEAREILKANATPRVCFTGLLHVLGIREDDFNPTVKRKWRYCNTTILNLETAIYKQVQEGKLSFHEAGYATIDIVPHASDTAEIAVCYLNASLWFLKDLRQINHLGGTCRVYALKKMVLNCVTQAFITTMRLNPGMQFYTSRFALAIAAETITAAGNCATSEDAKLIVALFNSVMEKGRYNPLWMMPLVPICEANDMSIFTARLQAEFTLQLQYDENKCFLKSDEVMYQVYENHIRHVCRLDNTSASHVFAMEAILQKEGFTWKDISDTMSSKLSPRTEDGWLIQQNYLEGNLPFATLTEFKFNVNSIAHNPITELRAVRATNGFFSMADIETVIEISKGEIFPIIFSLDPPNNHQRFHPFQALRFKPLCLNNTDLLHTLLQTDYLMKSFSVGSDVSAKPPFKQRKCKEGLIAKLPPHMQKILAPVTERGAFINKMSRFWIQCDEVQYSVKKNGPFRNYRVGNVKMVVRTSPMEPGLDGKMQDSEERDPDSPELKFAKDLTENYDEISMYFPMFRRLKELCKLLVIGKFLNTSLSGRKLQSLTGRKFVPAALNDLKTSICYGGVYLNPQFKEVSIIPPVKGEVPYRPQQLPNANHHSFSTQYTFDAPTEVILHTEGNTNTLPLPTTDDLKRCSKPTILQSKTRIVMQKSLKEARIQMTLHLNRALDGVKHSTETQRKQTRGAMRGQATTTSGSATSGRKDNYYKGAVGGAHGRGEIGVLARGANGRGVVGSGAAKPTYGREYRHLETKSAGLNRSGVGADRGATSAVGWTDSRVQTPLVPGFKEYKGNGDCQNNLKGKLVVTTAVLLLGCFKTSYEVERKKHEKCARYQINEASDEDQKKASEIIPATKVIRNIAQQVKFRKYESSRGKSLNGMHVSHKVGLELIKVFVTIVDGSEIDVPVVRDSCNRFENFELAPAKVNKSDHVKVDNLIIKAIKECFTGRVTDTTWESLMEYKDRIEVIVQCLHADFWPAEISQRVQILREIVNPNDSAQNLWDMFDTPYTE